MALEFSKGKLASLKLGRVRLGLRGSLLVAFAIIAGMALAISIGAGALLGQLGERMAGLNDRDIPRLAASLQLSILSESLASQGPALLATTTEQSREERTRILKETQTAALAKLREITDLGANKTVIDSLQENVKSIADMIGSLDSAAKERLAAADTREKQYDGLRKAHATFVAAANPAMLDAQTAMNAVLGSANFSQDDATDAARAVEQLGVVISSVNLLAAEMTAALSASSNDTLETLQKSFDETQTRAKSSLNALAKNSGNAALKDAAITLLAFGEGKASIFKLRNEEIDAIYYGQLILDETRKLNRGLDMSVNLLVDAVRQETSAATKDTRSMISVASIVMAAMGALTLLGSALFVWLYVGRNILRRIGNLQRAMQRLSDGDLETEIVRSRQHDEIASMVSTLEVFRDGMIRARTLGADQDKDRIGKAERSSRIEARIAGFEDTVRTALQNLMASANAMQGTAESMSASADRSSALASAVAAAAEETSVNVQTVSSGTEELSSSISEISRQVAASAQVANKAVDEASATDTTMQGLAENAGRISIVVDLIQTIASQTNLLALNATIEAARAGEAGRGFAVVASEVKNLAAQTAKATDEIRAQIAGMQHAATGAVGAIRHIGQTIGEINEVTTAIAAAVEQQGAATREIARNIQHAAGGTSEVSSNIVGVSQASSDAGLAASEVLNASGGLRREADLLRQEIDAFLSNIRAA